MATEDTETEEGGQVEDTGEGGDESADDGGEGVERVAAKDDDKPARPNHKERKANKFREEKEARARAELELGELRGRYAALEGQFGELRQQIERDKREAQQSSASNEAKGKVTALRQQARNYLVQSAQAKDPETAQRLLDKHDELMDQADDLRDEMRDGARWEKRRGELAGQMPNQEIISERTYLEGRYPWIATNAEARALADARFNSLVSDKKRQPNRATMEEALTYAARVLGIGGRSAPTERSRQVYAGMGQRDGEMDEGGSSGGMSVEEVKNNLAFKRMAQLSYPELEPEQAYAKWAKAQGSPAKNGASAR